MANRVKKTELPSELRLDLVSKDWVVIAIGRGKRPEMFKKTKRENIEVAKENCPFCQIETQGKPILVYLNGERLVAKGISVPEKWSTVAIPNKFPALLPYPKVETKIEGGLYQTMTAAGFCELIVTRDHKKQLAELELAKVKEVFDVYHQRYLDLMEKDFVNYVSIFHNHGPEAGATQSHPHSQIITTPLVDVDLKNSLSHSRDYARRMKKCIYCEMIKWEKKSKKRIVFENKEFIAICPFASKSAFEIIISPKQHLSYFERIGEGEKWMLADIFRETLKKMCKALNYPSYNFYLHTSPCDGKNYDYYHWHWTILPKTSTWAGFEMGTRIEISVIAPEKAAEYLRKQ